MILGVNLIPGETILYSGVSSCTHVKSPIVFFLFILVGLNPTGIQYSGWRFMAALWNELNVIPSNRLRGGRTIGRQIMSFRFPRAAATGWSLALVEAAS